MAVSCYRLAEVTLMLPGKEGHPRRYVTQEGYPGQLHGPGSPWQSHSAKRCLLIDFWNVSIHQDCGLL